MSSLSQIQDFLGQKRFAIVGVSRQPKDFSRSLLREFRARNYDAVPVNPDLTEIDGLACFAHVRDVQPAVDGVLLMTSPVVTDQVVQECAEVGVKRVWMYRAGGKGAVSEAAVRYCEGKGISVIPGECPLMFLAGGSWFHRAHGFIRKITGAYPN